MAKPGITSKLSNLRLPSKKWLVGGGIIAAGLLALTQCGDDGEQNASSGSEAATPVDTSKTYYQIINDATLSDQDSPDKTGYDDNDLVMARGSCVEGVFSGGTQIEGDRTYRVRATDAEGNVKEGYVFLGHVGDKALDPTRADFTCKTQFVTATATPQSSAPVVPTYVAGETLRLRDGSKATEIWGTLATGSCVTFAGGRDGDLIQIGHLAQGENPQDMQYKWVVEAHLQTSTIPADRCYARVTQGADAGITPNF